MREGHGPTVLGALTPPLSAEGRALFARHGFVRINGAITSRTRNVLLRAYDQVLEESSYDPSDAWVSPGVDGRSVIQRFNRLDRYHHVIRDFASSSAVLHQIARALLGQDVRFIGWDARNEGAVMVIKDARNIGQHAALPWHRDGDFTLNRRINPFVNIGVYLDASTEDRGCLVVLPPHAKGASSMKAGTTLSVAGEISVPASQGDIVVHSSSTWHRSGSAVEPGATRCVLYMNYTARRDPSKMAGNAP